MAFTTTSFIRSVNTRPAYRIGYYDGMNRKICKSPFKADPPHDIAYNRGYIEGARAKKPKSL